MYRLILRLLWHMSHSKTNSHILPQPHLLPDPLSELLLPPHTLECKQLKSLKKLHDVAGIDIILMHGVGSVM